jgi:hypothetical protein
MSGDAGGLAFTRMHECFRPVRGAIKSTIETRPAVWTRVRRCAKARNGLHRL